MARNTRSATHAAFFPMEGSALHAAFDSMNRLERIGEIIGKSTKPPRYGVAAGVMNAVQWNNKINFAPISVLDSLNPSFMRPGVDLANWYGSLAEKIIGPVNTLNTGAAMAAINIAVAHSRGIVGPIQTPLVRAAMDAAMWQGAMSRGVLGSVNMSVVGSVLEGLGRQSVGLGVLADARQVSAASLAVEAAKKYVAAKGTTGDAAELLRATTNDDALIGAAEAVLRSQQASELIREFKGERFEEIVTSIRKVDDPARDAELEAQFEKVPNGEALLDQTYTALNLTVPFGHDPAVRAAAQVVLTAVISVIMVGIIIGYPVAGIVFSVVGSPVKLTWRAVGVAYDRLYDKKHNHRDKLGHPRQPPNSRGQNGNESAW